MRSAFGSERRAGRWRGQRRQSLGVGLVCILEGRKKAGFIPWMNQVPEKEEKVDMREKKKYLLFSKLSFPGHPWSDGPLGLRQLCSSKSHWNTLLHPPGWEMGRAGRHLSGQRWEIGLGGNWKTREPLSCFTVHYVTTKGHINMPPSNTHAG